MSCDKFFAHVYPWLVIVILLTSVVVTMVFSTDLKGWDFIILFGIFYFTFSITYTMHDISYWGMIPAPSSDANARDQFTSRATLCAGIGGTLASILIPMLTTGTFALGGSANVAYGRIALVISILAPLFLCFTIFGVRERRDASKTAKSAGGLKKTVKTLTGNDQLLWISLIFLIQQIGNGIVVGVLVIGYMLSNFGQYSYYLIMMISIINTVEYNEYKHGVREEAVIASVRPFITKMSSALIVAFTSISYMIFGVTNYTNQISDLESAAAGGLMTETEKLTAIEGVISGVEQGQTLGLLICMTVVPCVLMLISYFLYQKKYKLDEAEYDRICKVIGEKDKSKID